MEPSFKQALDQLDGPYANTHRAAAGRAVHAASEIFVTMSDAARRELEGFYESEVDPAPTADFPLNDASAQLHKEHCIVHIDLRCCSYCHKLEQKMASCSRCRHVWCAAFSRLALWHLSSALLTMPTWCRAANSANQCIAESG